jgi:hypothetical protein
MAWTNRFDASAATKTIYEKSIAKLSVSHAGQCRFLYKSR